MFTRKNNICFDVLCIMAMVCLLLFVPVANIDIALANNVESKQNRLKYFYDINVDGMNMEYKTDVVRSSTKTLLDFAGNTYTLIECSPTGYMIICDDSATVIEYSAPSISPYSGFTTDLYYGGPTYYFVYEDNILKHTITNETFPEYNSDKSLVNSATAICEEMHNDLTSQPNTVALDYINTGVMQRTSLIGIYGEMWTCVKNMSFFINKQKAKQIGYLDGGYCGYIAANLLLGFYDTFVKDCMDDNWLYMTGSGVDRHFTGSGLTERLLTFGPNNDNSSTSTTVRETLNKYFKYYGYELGSYDMITPFFSGSTLKNLIDKEIPSILFGNLGPDTSPTEPPRGNGDNHAVVVYGYKKGGTGGAFYSFLVHYGWPDRSIATINYLSYSVFGSMYHIVS